MNSIKSILCGLLDDTIVIFEKKRNFIILTCYVTISYLDMVLEVDYLLAFYKLNITLVSLNVSGKVTLINDNDLAYLCYLTCCRHQMRLILTS